MLFKWFISNPYSNRQFELEPISKVADIQKYTVLNFPVGRATQLNMKSNTLTSSRNIASVPQENIIYLIILSHILPQSFVIAIPILMTTCRDKPTGIALLLRSLNSIQYIQYLWYCAVPSLVAQLCPTLGDPMDCSLPGSSVHGDSPGKNPGVGCHALLQGIFPTQGSKLGLLHYRQILYRLSHQGSPRILQWVA